MIPALLLWTKTWLPPEKLCDDSAIYFPNQITYAVEYRVRAMQLDPGCPRLCPVDQDGNVIPGQPCTDQPCAVVVAADQWDVGASLQIDSDVLPNPPPGAAFILDEPVACNPAGCGCAP